MRHRLLVLVTMALSVDCTEPIAGTAGAASSSEGTCDRQNSAGDAAGDTGKCGLKSDGQTSQDLAQRPEVLLITLVLPDGMGDVIFGECAALELSVLPTAVRWLRVYPSEASRDAGEALVANVSARVAHSSCYATPEAFAQALTLGSLDALWGDAQEVFLAPWIFGIYVHDGPLLELVKRKKRHFWSLTEYGRGMGPIHSYSGGFGSRLPTGWPSAEQVTDRDNELEESAVFKTILRAELTGTDWRRRYASRLGLHGTASNGSGLPIRLWWAYGRKDSARAHEFLLMASGKAEDSALGSDAIPKVAKLVPVNENGSLAKGNAKTRGELLAEQAQALMENPEHQADVNVAVAGETDAHIAGQLSELLVHILTRNTSADEERDKAEVVVAPNADLESWAGSNTVQVVSLEMVKPSGERVSVQLGRPVFIVAESVPREEMRSFLEQCEKAVVATGDQSVAEAVLLGKVPMTKPDAKVSEWERAVTALAMDRIADVPDLGEKLRQLVVSTEAREDAAAWSEAMSLQVEAKIRAQMGAAWSATAETLARSGMFG